MKKEKNLKITPYLYLVPSILIFAVFLFYPFVKTVYLSLFMTNKMGQAKIFVGLQNYIDLLSSESFKSYIGLCCHRCTRRNAPGIDCCSSL